MSLGYALRRIGEEYPLAKLEPPAGHVLATVIRKGAPDELRKALGDSVEPVDVAPQAAEIAKQAPLYKCDGCAAAIAKTLGADLAVSGYVEKGSNQIFNLTVTIAESATGKVIRGGRVVIRADTDDTWAHAMRWVVKNRLLTEPLPNRS